MNNVEKPGPPIEGEPQEGIESREPEPVTGDELVKAIDSEEFKEALKKAGKFCDTTGHESGFEIFRSAYDPKNLMYTEVAEEIEGAAHLERSSTDFLSQKAKQGYTPFYLIGLHFHPDVAGEDPITPSFQIDEEDGFGASDLFALNVSKINPGLGMPKMMFHPVECVVEIDKKGNYTLLMVQETFDESLHDRFEQMLPLEDDLDEAKPEGQEKVLEILRENGYKAEVIGISNKGKISDEDKEKIKKFADSPKIVGSVEESYSEDEIARARERDEIARAREEGKENQKTQAQVELERYHQKYSPEERKNLEGILPQIDPDFRDQFMDDYELTSAVIGLRDALEGDIDLGFLRNPKVAELFSTLHKSGKEFYFEKGTANIEKAVADIREKRKDLLDKEPEMNSSLENFNGELSVYDEQFRDRAIAGIWSVLGKNALKFNFLIESKRDIDPDLERVCAELPEFSEEIRLDEVRIVSIETLQEELKSISDGNLDDFEDWKFPMYDFVEILEGDLMSLKGAKQKQLARKVEGLRGEIMKEAERNTIFRAYLMNFLDYEVEREIQ